MSPVKGYRKPVLDTEQLLDACALILTQLQVLEPQSQGLFMALAGIDLARRKTLPATEPSGSERGA